MSTNGYFDLSTIFDVQQNQIVDLSNSYPNVDNASNIVANVNELQNRLMSLSSEYDSANTESSAVLTQQNEMKAIVNTEHKRLLEKQALIDEAQAEQERKALLNTTYRKKYAHYSKMMIVFSVTLLCVIGLTLASRAFTIFPQSAYSVLTASVIAIGIIYIIILYADLSGRDNINYDEIVRQPPKKDKEGNLITGSPDSKKNSMWDAFNKCKGGECCAPGTKWDENLKLCVPVLSSAAPTTSAGPRPTVGPTTSAAPTTSAGPRPTVAPTPRVAPTPTVAPTPVQSGFTTIQIASNYGEYYGKSILPSGVTNNSKNYWMGSTNNVQPNTYSMFNDFLRI